MSKKFSNDKSFKNLPVSPYPPSQALHHLVQKEFHLWPLKEPQQRGRLCLGEVLKKDLTGCSAHDPPPEFTKKLI